MDLWNKYLGYHPEIISRLSLIDTPSKNKFLKKLKKEKDKSNFSSTLTELSFYEFFQRLGFTVEYDKVYGKFSPDLTVSKNGNRIIAEVVRLNPTEKDSIRNDFENDLLEEIENIKIGCWMRVRFKKEYFDVTLYKKDDILQALNAWLKDNCKEGGEITLFDNFTFKVTKVDNKYDHVCVFGNTNSIDIDARRLNADNSRFIKKIGKYEQLINEQSLPYLLCIKIDFHAALGKEEMFWTLYGDLVFHNDYRIYHSETNGIYYKNESAKNLSGVLLMVRDKISYFHNFKESRLGVSIKNEFLDYQYYCETFNKLTYLKLVKK